MTEQESTTFRFISCKQCCVQFGRGYIRPRLCDSCRKERSKLRHRHQRAHGTPTIAPEEFKAFYLVDELTGCWVWTGKMRSRLYGEYGYWLAHRVSYQIHVGPIPDGLCVLHNCPGGNDNPLCVNPDHLWLGTKGDNNKDRDRKGRHRPSGTKGTEIGVSRLNEDSVRSIRELYGSGPTMQKLADRFGVGLATISRVVRRKNWKHIA